MLRPVALKPYLGILASLGVDQKNLFADIEISPASMDDPAYLVDFGQYLRLFENLGRCDRFPGLGIEFGLRSTLADTGILGCAALFCRSVRQSMEELWACYGAAFGLMAIPRFGNDDRKTVAVEFSLPPMSEGAYRLCIEDALCRIANMGTSVAGSKAAFEQITLSYSAPDYRERYREIFQCPITFRAKRTRAIIKRDWIERPLKTRDEALLGVYLQNLQQIDQHIKSVSPIVDQARERLLRCDGATLLSQLEVARDIGLSGRTLCRALQKHGTTYRSLVEEVRVERARICMDSGQFTAKGIAYQTGYRNLCAFRRAFKKWTGQTVRQYCLTKPCVAERADHDQRRRKSM